MKINGEAIDPSVLSDEFRRLMQTQADRPDEIKVSEETVKNVAEENVITRILLVNEARNRFPEVSEKELKRKRKELSKQYGPTFDLGPFQGQIEDDIRVDKLIQETQKAIEQPDESEARKRYEADPSQWEEPEQVHCSHIVRHVFGGADPNASLQQIIEAQRLINDGVPFEQVSKQFSDQFGQAGDLGTFPRGHMVDSFENVVFRMNSGEISDVFKTEFGYHIVLLHEKIPAKARSFEEAKGLIMQTLRSERKEKAVESLVADLQEGATIEYTDS